jgi:hypothetical protein
MPEQLHPAHKECAQICCPREFCDSVLSISAGESYGDCRQTACWSISIAGHLLLVGPGVSTSPIPLEPPEKTARKAG